MYINKRKYAVYLYAPPKVLYIFAILLHLKKLEQKYRREHMLSLMVNLCCTISDSTHVLSINKIKIMPFACTRDLYCRYFVCMSITSATR